MFGFLKKKIKEFIGSIGKEIREEKVEESEKGKIKKEPEKKGIFERLKTTITSRKITEKHIDCIFEKLEILLIENNVAVEVIDHLHEKLRKDLTDKEISGNIDDMIKQSLKNAVSELLVEPFDLIEKIKSAKEKPFVILFFGINGSGKTTTIAKLAYMLKNKNISAVMAASDTFRAASLEQLEHHSEKLKIKLIKHDYGADPSAVAFDAISHAKSKGIDVVLIDTAGRMHTKTNLMNEMQKICRVTKPSLKIFVGEATTGNDAVEQAKTFNEMIGIDALILTKADVDEKGGAVISVSYVTKKPIIFLGTGQEYNDLKIFSKKETIENIFS